MTIDSHVHFWKYSKESYPWIDNNMKILQKDHLPIHLQPTLDRNGMDGVIAVQADGSELETLFLVELAKTNSLIKGVVGWVDLQAANVEDRLQYFSQFPVIRGYRHIVQSEPDDFMAGAGFRRGIQALQPFGYSYDILIYPSQLPAATELARDFPQQVFILDHCAKPDIKRREMENWKLGIEKLAANPNVYCKLSGLFTEAKWKEWSAGDFYPYLDVVFQNFGTDRLLFGTDWPVMLVSGIYVQWKSLIEKYMENMLPEEKEAVFGGNAERVYRL